MAAIRRANTRPEVELRSVLHRLGMRFRKDLLICAGSTRARPDIVFTRRKLAVFVDGCFWHGCPKHSRIPVNNGDYWAPKLQGNIARDRQQAEALRNDGWAVLRVWEHEPLATAAARVRLEYARLEDQACEAAGADTG